MIKRKMTKKTKIKEIDIIVSAPEWNDDEAIIKKSILLTIHYCFESEYQLGFPKLGKISGKNGFSVCCNLTNDAEITEINRQWRQKAQPTNVLSFPNLEKDNMPILPPGAVIPLGDIIFAYETIDKEADAADILFMDHINRLVVHGMFHLFGYDHTEKEDYVDMIRREIEILGLLGIQKTADIGYISLD